ncbi:MAG: choice-of-anchor V domain-containing protein [Hyphomicrobiales bacterium]
MTPRYRTARSTLAAIALAVAFVAAVSAPTLVQAYPDTPPPGRTGAPSENTCRTCHSGTLNDGVATFELRNLPAAYMPGETYSLTVSLRRTGMARWGFSLTSLRDSDNAFAGSLSTGGSALLLIQSKSSRDYISQTTDFGSNDGTYADWTGGVTWTFDWTAPPAGTGTVTFYAAGVAANNDNSASSADDVYTFAVPLVENVTTDVTTTTWGRIKRVFMER